MARAENTDAIAKATNRSWNNWVELLASHDDTHQSLAACALANIHVDVDKRHWWSQAVAVAYEQHVGRRQPGQRLDGKFEVAVSKTINHARADVASAWHDWFDAYEDINGCLVENTRTSSTDIRDYTRADAGDAKLEAAIESKTATKSLLVVSMSQLASDDARSQWRDYWKDQLSAFADSL